MKARISGATKNRNRNPFVLLSSETVETMKTSLLNIETVTEYDDMLGVETLHPLVSVIDLSQAKPMHHMRHTFSFYVIFLKDEKNCDLIYGRQRYDYQKGSVVCLAPGQVIGIEDTGETFQPQGYALCFHPDLIRGTNLGRTIKEYTFFSYEVNEALHLSEEERHTVIDCLHIIDTELRRPADKHSRRLITANIGLLLDYCMRFYERQFTTREASNKDIIVRFEQLLDEYFDGQTPQEEGLPTVKYFAERVFLSPNYFGDMISKQTGKTASEYIQSKVVERAKDMLLSTTKPMSEIAYSLGFQYPQHMSRMFKRLVGHSPNKYRTQQRG